MFAGYSYEPNGEESKAQKDQSDGLTDRCMPATPWLGPEYALFGKGQTIHFSGQTELK